MTHIASTHEKEGRHRNASNQEFLTKITLLEIKMEQGNMLHSTLTDLELIDAVLLKNVAGGVDETTHLEDSTCTPPPGTCGGRRGCSAQQYWENSCGG